MPSKNDLRWINGYCVQVDNRTCSRSTTLIIINLKKINIRYITHFLREISTNHLIRSARIKVAHVIEDQTSTKLAVMAIGLEFKPIVLSTIVGIAGWVSKLTVGGTSPRIWFFFYQNANLKIWGRTRSNECALVIIEFPNSSTSTECCISSGTTSSPG